MAKITPSKFARKFEVNEEGRLVKRKTKLPAEPRGKQTCPQCGKEYLIAPGQMIRCKHK